LFLLLKGAPPHDYYTFNQTAHLPDLLGAKKQGIRASASVTQLHKRSANIGFGAKLQQAFFRFSVSGKFGKIASVYTLALLAD